MVWFKVDDGFAFHPKVIALPDSAVALWTRAGSWCAGNLTDGFLPAAMLGVLRGKHKDAAQLVQAGLWIAVEGGWRFHDWQVYQPTRDQVLAERSAAADRQRRGRETQRARREGHGSSHGVTSPVSHIGTHGVSHGGPDPTRPVVPTELSTALPPKRGKRLPDDWQPSSTALTWALAECPNVDRRTETEKFGNYWRAKSGKDAAKLDWDATWRNWMLTARERTPTRSTRTIHEQ